MRSDPGPAEVYPAFQFDFEPDEGFNLASGKAWKGYRVRWRVEGERNYRRFLLDPEGLPYEDMMANVLEVIRRLWKAEQL